MESLFYPVRGKFQNKLEDISKYSALLHQFGQVRAGILVPSGAHFIHSEIMIRHKYYPDSCRDIALGDFIDYEKRMLHKNSQGPCGHPGDGHGGKTL